MTQTDHAAAERLFSYGTLHLEPVQLATFRRKLDGQADHMPGYILANVYFRKRERHAGK